MHYGTGGIVRYPVLLPTSTSFDLCWIVVSLTIIPHVLILILDHCPRRFIYRPWTDSISKQTLCFNLARDVKTQIVTKVYIFFQ